MKKSRLRKKMQNSDLTITFTRVGSDTKSPFTRVRAMTKQRHIAAWRSVKIALLPKRRKERLS